MPDITNVKGSQPGYGKSSWGTQTTLQTGGTNNFIDKLLFPTLSAGSRIDSLTFTFWNETANSASIIFNFYSSTALVSPPTNVPSSATSLGALTWSRSNAQWITVTFTRAMMDVIGGYTGDWWLYVQAPDGENLTTWTGTGTNGAYFSGSYTDTSIDYNASGTFRSGNPWYNVAGTFRKGVAWTNVAGTFRRGI